MTAVNTLVVIMISMAVVRQVFSLFFCASVTFVGRQKGNQMHEKSCCDNSSKLTLGDPP